MEEVMEAIGNLRARFEKRGGVLPARLGVYPVSLQVVGVRRRKLRIKFEEHPDVQSVEMEKRGRNIELAATVRRLVIPISHIGSNWDIDLHLEGAVSNSAQKAVEKVIDGTIEETLLSVIKLKKPRSTHSVLISDSKSIDAPFTLRKIGGNLVIEASNPHHGLRIMPDTENILRQVLEMHATAVRRNPKTLKRRGASIN
ncbi:MAG: hypothetical protein V1644_03235 [Candidatus Micrarchaeota archaeon]